jgi:hypothetical protein
MMTSLILSGLALTFFTGAVLAQSPAPPPPGASAQAEQKAPPPPPGGGPDAMDEGPGGPPPPPGGPRGHHPPPPPPSKAAHFRLERGDMALDVKCADDEPMKACADIALQMLDKLQAQPKP